VFFLAFAKNQEIQ